MEIALIKFFKDRIRRDRSFLLSNIPEDVETNAWRVIVRLSTRNNTKISNNYVYKQLDRLDKHRIDRNERKYVKMGKDLSTIPIDLLDRHLNYVKGLFDYEKKRQENIEKKALQLISQSSIIISIITLVVGMSSEKLATLNDYSTWILVVLFSLVLILLSFAIYFSILSLNVRLFRRPSHTLFITQEARDEKQFIYNETCTLYDNVEDNIAIDNKKAFQMNNGYLFFKWGIFFIAIFSVFIFFSIFKFEKNETGNQTNNFSSGQLNINAFTSNEVNKVLKKLDDIKNEISISEGKDLPQNNFITNSCSLSPLMLLFIVLFNALLIYVTLSVPYFHSNFWVKLLVSLTVSSLITCTIKFAFDFNYELSPINITNNYCCDTISNSLNGLDSIGAVGPFITGTTQLRIPKKSQLFSLSQVLKKDKYKEIYVFGGVDKRQLKGSVAKLFGDNLSLSQARANMVKDSLKHYLKGYDKLTIFTYLSGANYYGKDSIGYSNDRYVKIYAK